MELKWSRGDGGGARGMGGIYRGGLWSIGGGGSFSMPGNEASMEDKTECGIGDGRNGRCSDPVTWRCRDVEKKMEKTEKSKLTRNSQPIRPAVRPFWENENLGRCQERQGGIGQSQEGWSWHYRNASATASKIAE